MVIFGVKISTKKKIKYALTNIHGIGLNTSTQICNQLGFSPNLTVSNLTEAQITNITKLIKDKYIIENNLRKINRLNIRRLVKNKTYRGFRHLNGLPVRGQRTSTNAKTQKRLRRFIAK